MSDPVANINNLLAESLCVNIGCDRQKEMGLDFTRLSLCKALDKCEAITVERKGQSVHRHGAFLRQCISV